MLTRLCTGMGGCQTCSFGADDAGFPAFLWSMQPDCAGLCVSHSQIVDESPKYHKADIL